MADTAARLAERLVELGFSQYEARAYLGLLGQQPMTGYGLANATRIPQPKVYETLRRLVDKGAVVQVGADPARFVAVPAEQLLTQLDSEFRRRLADARVGLARLAATPGQVAYRALETFDDWPAVAERARALLEGAERHVYLSAHDDQLAGLLAAVSAADARGVRVDLLHFGPLALELRNGSTVRHASTDGVVYRRHQARHLALVADSHQTLWALAPDGDRWDAVAAADPLLAALVKGYVRHDLYVQRIFADFGEALRARYGPSMEELTVPDVPDLSPATPAGTERQGRRRA
jgi:HTH-type transcriptional regulator, sugar sensing transcriptional regulator